MQPSKIALAESCETEFLIMRSKGRSLEDGFYLQADSGQIRVLKKQTSVC